MNLLTAAVEISPTPVSDEANYEMSIELIIAVVALILQNCDLDIPNIINRSRRMTIIDRVRIRLFTMQQRAKLPDLAARIEAFCNRQTDETLESLIREAQAV